MLRKNIIIWVVLILLSLAPSLLGTAKAQGGYDPALQTQILLYDEARTVYLGNLARRDKGIPPLRWNSQLTYAARWFSWDSIENRSAGFCGHQDAQGHWPDYRASAFGYLGSAGAENAFCGYVTPEYAIKGWMNSPGHRANLLDPNSREIGLGYYLRDSDGRGYVTQDFGNDAVYAPVIIENEAISTINPDVNIYIYDRSIGGGFAGLGAATQMMMCNNAHFYDAAWEPYTSNKTWTLANGDGWREVYVKTRDKFDRSLTVSDTIYLGANIPLNELGVAQMSTTQSQVTLYNLNGGTLPQAQFSLGWLADDTYGTFEKLWGNGERVNDAAAWGGTAYRLYPGDNESRAWVYDTTFIKDTPLVAYFRLKVNDNTSSSEVARISVQGGDTEYGPLSLRGTDFTVPNQYQEFALNFTFNTDPEDVFLMFNFWRSGNADVYVDAVSIFSAPQAITSPLTWSVPGNNYRGQGVWVRYTNGSQFSALSEAATSQAPSYTISISGNTGVGGATVSYNECMVKSVVSDGSGNYSITVPAGWSGTLTPSKPGYVFLPANMSYANVLANQTAQNYTAIDIPVVTSIIPDSIDPSAISVDFTVTFSKPVTNVDAADFKLTNTVLTGTSITNVTGTGAGPYTVTVDTGRGNGTIRLDVIKTASIQDMVGIAFVGPYTGGETYTVYKGTAPTVPVLKSPASNALVADYLPTLDWNDSSEVIALANDWSYEVNVTAPLGVYDETFNTPSGFSNSTYTFTDPLPANTTFSWKVRAYNDANQYSAWSATRTFRTKPPSTKLDTPELNSPTDLASLDNKRPAFDWDAVPGTTTYTLQIWKDVKVVNTGTIKAPAHTYTPSVDLLPSTEYQWKVKANNGVNSGDYSAPFTFTTSENPPKMPVLSAPANNALVNGTLGQTLKWSPVLPATGYPAAASYEVEYAANSAFTGSITATVAVTEQPITIGSLLPNRTYYWHVRSWSAANNHSAWSAARTFRTMLATPVLNLPSDGITENNKRPTFSWDEVPGTTTYTLQILKAGKVVNTGTIKALAYVYTPAVDLLPGTTYQWKVKANGTNTGVYSAPFTFTTSGNPPKVPVLSAPANNALMDSVVAQTLDWNQVLGITTASPATTYPVAASFEVEYAMNSSFSGVSDTFAVVNDNTIAGTHTAPIPLLPGRTYYWRVRSWSGSDATGNHSAWSLVRTIKVKFVAPMLDSVIVTDGSPTFTWHSANGLWTNYTLLVINPATNKVVKSITVPAPTTTYTMPAALLPTGTYRWQVKINGLYTPIPSAISSGTFDK